MCIAFVLLVFVLFFFFKQKTAYEMRISDWSSDVCSSDLKAGDHQGDGGRIALGVCHQQDGGAHGARAGDQRRRQGKHRDVVLGGGLAVLLLGGGDAAGRPREDPVTGVRKSVVEGTSGSGPEYKGGSERKKYKNKVK